MQKNISQNHYGCKDGKWGKNKRRSGDLRREKYAARLERHRQKKAGVSPEAKPSFAKQSR